MRLKEQQRDDSMIYLNQWHESNKLVIRGNKKLKGVSQSRDRTQNIAGLT